jgi:hypothetical protein
VFVGLGVRVAAGGPPQPFGQQPMQQ